MTNMTTRKRESPERVEAQRLAQTPVFVPSVDVREDEEAFTVWCDLPGVESKDIDLRFERGLLEIRAKATPRQGESTSYLLREYGVGDFARTFNLSDTIDPARISAEFKDGVLTLTLPKVEAVRPKRIQVRSA